MPRQDSLERREVAQEAAELLDVQPGDRVLEPSAGTGALLAAIGDRIDPTVGSVVAIEVNRDLAEMLTTQFPKVTVICADFLEQMADAVPGFDKILMNPPFENGADIKHIEHALKMLKPGGKLVAICANGSRQQAKAEASGDKLEGAFGRHIRRHDGDRGTPGHR